MALFKFPVFEYWQQLEIDRVTGNGEKSFCVVASPPAPPPYHAYLFNYKRSLESSSGFSKGQETMPAFNDPA